MAIVDVAFLMHLSPNWVKMQHCRCIFTSVQLHCVAFYIFGKFISIILSEPRQWEFIFAMWFVLARKTGGYVVKNAVLLTSHTSFMLVESVDVALVSSTTSPDSRLARASLRSRPVLKSFCKSQTKKKKNNKKFKNYNEHLKQRIRCWKCITN